MQNRNFYLIDLEQINGVKSRIMESDFHDQFKLLMGEADKYLRMPIKTVTDKTTAPISGDKHDYMSLAKYWWSNPDTVDSLPYVRQDGEVNPEIEKYDVNALTDLTKAVHTLSFAYFYTQDEKFADRASDWLRAWFINSETMMNPNFQYAQFIPGKEHKGNGIIEGNRLRWIPDSVSLINSYISSEEVDAVRSWFSKLSEWLISSEFGNNVANKSNNQAVWHANQVGLYSEFSQRPHQMFEKAEKLIDTQIARDGSMPNELMRTRSFHYHLFNLEAFVDLAILARASDKDLFNYSSQQNAGIRTSLEFLIPYITKSETWPHPQITAIHWPLVKEVFRRCAYAYRELRYEDIISQLPKTGINDPTFTVDWLDLIYPRFKD